MMLGVCRRHPGPKSATALDERPPSMSEVLVASPAEQDFTEALCWYAERSRQAAEGFEAEFEHALESIKADPHRFPLCDRRHRYYLMRRYLFQVIYREHGHHLVIIAVAHTKRQPGYWSERSSCRPSNKDSPLLQAGEGSRVRCRFPARAFGVEVGATRGPVETQSVVPARTRSPRPAVRLKGLADA
jgi:plasmid stabilization system protein ParE